MTISGHVENGMIVLDQSIPLVDGTRVRVEVLSGTTEVASGNAPTLLERYSSIVGAVEDLPEDFARNHDHYLHGQPKQQ